MSRTLIGLVAIVFVLVACGSSATATPIPTPIPTATLSPTPTSVPTPLNPTASPTLAPTSPSSSLSADQSIATPVRIFVPTPNNLQFMSFWVALGADLFKKEGLDVRIELPPVAGGGAQFIFQGRADVGVFPPPQYLNLIGQGQPIFIFANLLQNDPVNLVIRKEVVEEREISLSA